MIKIICVGKIKEDYLKEAIEEYKKRYKEATEALFAFQDLVFKYAAFIKEDLYNEVKQFGSLKLKSSVARFFEVKDKRMLVIYNELAVPAIADEIAKMTLLGKVKIYVFAPGNYAYDDEFFEVQNKVELCALPAAIYNAYQKVLPKRKTKLLDDVQDESEEVDNNGELNLNFGEE